MDLLSPRTNTHTDRGIFLGCSVSAMLLLCSPPAESGEEFESLKIVAIVHRCSGRRHTVTCRVKAGLLKAETSVYWLVNGSFVEDSYPDGRVRTNNKCGNALGESLQSTLVFKELLPEDFSTTLTCVALNPAGFEQNTTTLSALSSMKKKKRHEDNSSVMLGTQCIHNALKIIL